MATYIADCTICGKEYFAKRLSSRFCSARCRQINHRKHKNNINAQHEASIIIDAVKRLQKTSIAEVYNDSVTTGEQLSQSLESLSEMFEQFTSNKAQ